jgi:hypothetical protein
VETSVTYHFFIQDTGESSIQEVVAPVEEETKDGYMKMQNLSKTNLFQNVREETTADAITHNASPTPTNDSESGQNSSRRSRVKSFRPLSHPEIMFTNFDKYIPKEAIEFTNKMLGRGQFGQVELAYATINGVRKKCAVKMIRGSCNFIIKSAVKREFLLHVAKEVRHCIMKNQTIKLFFYTDTIWKQFYT